jgi:hypothetical protein
MYRTNVNKVLLPAVLALACAGTSLHAQIVRGVVVEEGLDAPVEGAMVILMDLDGRTVDRVLTDADGEFMADADRPGPHLIRIDRIGYESLTTERFDVPVNGTYQTVTLPIRPVELMGINVEGSRRCEVRPEEGRSTARVWEEARKALQAAAWTQSSGAYRYTLLQYSRELEPDGRRVKNETREFQRTLGQAPYVSAPAQELVDSGFVRQNPDRTFTYFAPDADAFLSDAFLDTHCMRLEEVKDGLIGLGFEPVSGRRVADISGTIWIDAATAQLRRLEFRYQDLPRGLEPSNPRASPTARGSYGIGTSECPCSPGPVVNDCARYGSDTWRKAVSCGGSSTARVRRSSSRRPRRWPGSSETLWMPGLSMGSWSGQRGAKRVPRGRSGRALPARSCCPDWPLASKRSS